MLLLWVNYSEFAEKLEAVTREWPNFPPCYDSAFTCKVGDKFGATRQ